MSTETDRNKKFILWFEDVGIVDVPLVGGKNASLGEMIRNLGSKGVSVPGGFAITAYAYQYLLKEAGIENAIQEALEGLDTHDMKNLADRGQKVRDIIYKAEFPDDLKNEIIENYHKMSERYGTENLDVAVRSSATAEDLPDASFAGQQETYLNIRGDEQLIESCKRCFASLFTNRAISYRTDKGFGHFDVYLSIAVQKMIRSDSASSGVLFSIDTESGFKDACYITGSWGLGENVVQGAVNPDEFYVYKPLLNTGKVPIISKRIGEKAIKMVYTEPGDAQPVKNIDTPIEDRKKLVINDEEVLVLAKWATIIEEHYTQEAKDRAAEEGIDLPDDYVKPMDIEWAKDGDGVTVGDGKLYIVQARPETVHSQREISRVKNGITEFHLEHYAYTEQNVSDKYERLVVGRAVGKKIGKGVVHNIFSVENIGDFKKGQILVTDMTDPDWEPIMKIAGAIVTNRGGRTCHAAIISRELGIPCIVGTGNAAEELKTGTEVTVSCVEGDEGYVYKGDVPYEVKDEWVPIPNTRTKIMMNCGSPEMAFDQGQIPNDGVGLARVEFTINSHIGIHPRALINYAELQKKVTTLEGAEKAKLQKALDIIADKTYGYDDVKQFYVDQLAEGVARIAAGFYPGDVIVRMSDFKSNEYANLVGGYLYEPVEANPMIGWRGASRYYDPEFKPSFKLECEAILKVRDVMGFDNVKIMIPFCRTPTEGREVIKVLNEFGLHQGDNGLEVYVMAEIPSNVIAADEFADIFDGFSIGSNDLTQLTLGLDRDSALVAHIYNERESAVYSLIASVIKTARRRGKKIGICGQAPSDYPEFAQFLVEQGINSISLNSDTVLQTKMFIAEKEKELGINPDEE